MILGSVCYYELMVPVPARACIWGVAWNSWKSLDVRIAGFNRESL